MQPVPEPPAGPLTWTVGPQTITTIPDGRGGYVQAYHIPFTLSNGHMDTVDVPVTDYGVEGVKAAIQAKAAEIAAVYGLTGTVG